MSLWAHFRITALHVRFPRAWKRNTFISKSARVAECLFLLPKLLNFSGKHTSTGRHLFPGTRRGMKKLCARRLIVLIYRCTQEKLRSEIIQMQVLHLNAFIAYNREFDIAIYHSITIYHFLMTPCYAEILIFCTIFTVFDKYHSTWWSKYCIKNSFL
jgi:hypothetical protein